MRIGYWWKLRKLNPPTHVLRDVGAWEGDEVVWFWAAWEGAQGACVCDLEWAAGEEGGF